MGFSVIEVGAGADELNALLEHAEADMDRLSGNGGRGEDRYFVIVPSRLRPYAERRVLERRTDAAIAVHSFASFAGNVIGNCDGGRYARRRMSDFAMQAFVRHCMSADRTLFAGTTATHGFVALAAKQLRELLNDAVPDEALTRCGIRTGSVRMRSLAVLVRLFRERYGNRYAPVGGTGDVIVPWAGEHASATHWYLYGFDDLSGSELRATVAILDGHGTVTAAVRSGRPRPAFCDLLEGNTAANMTLEAINSLAQGTATSGRVISMSLADPVEESRWVADAVVEDLQAGISPRDILVCSRSPEAYGTMVEREFADRGLHVNGVSESTLADHEFADVLLGLLDPALYSFDPSAIMRVFSHRLIGGDRLVSAQSVDILQAYLLTHVVTAEMWASDAAWASGQENDAATVNGMHILIRNLILEAKPVFGVTNAARGDTVTVREALASMVAFLIAHRVDRLLVAHDGARPAEGWQAHDDRARRAWNTVMGLFDDLVDIAGDDPFEQHAYGLAQGLEAALALESVAPKDAVNGIDVSSYAQPLHPYRRIYCMGSCKDIMPAVAHESDLLGDTEREWLCGELAGEPLTRYALLSRTIAGKSGKEPRRFNDLAAHATERIVFTYPRSMDGNDQSPSAYLNDAGLHPTPGNVPIRDYSPQRTDDGSISADHAMRLFTTDDGRGGKKLQVSVSSMETYFGNPLDYFARYGLRLDPLKPAELDAAVQGTYFHAVLERTVRALIAIHGDALIAPITPSGFSQEDPEESEDAAAARKALTDDILLRLHRYADILYRPDPNADAGDAAVGPRTLLEENPQFAVFEENDRMRAIRLQLETRIRNALGDFDAWRSKLQELIRCSTAWTAASNDDILRVEFAPKYVEQTFGTFRNSNDSADDMSLNDTLHTSEGDVTLSVRGKVDRIDVLTLRSGDQTLYSGAFVIDYKSSKHQLFDRRNAEIAETMATDVYYGHELQLLTYIRAVECMRQTTSEGHLLPPVVGAMFLPIAKAPFLEAGAPDENSPAVFVTQRFLAGNGRTGIEAMRRGNKDDDRPPLSGAVLSDLGLDNHKDSAYHVGLCPLDERSLLTLVEHSRRMILDGGLRLLTGDVGAHPSRIRIGNDYRDGNQYSDFRDLSVIEQLSDDYFRFQPAVPLKKILGTDQETDV